MGHRGEDTVAKQNSGVDTAAKDCGRRTGLCGAQGMMGCGCHGIYMLMAFGSSEKAWEHSLRVGHLSSTVCARPWAPSLASTCQK